MSIEFRCTQCNKLLRTADNTAGKQAKCPECNTVLTIPAAAEQAPGQPAAPGPAPAAGPASPFGAAGPQAGAENPYQAPADYTAAAGYAAPTPGAFNPTQMDVGDVFSRTWAIFKDQWGMCLGIVVVAQLLNMGVSLVCNFIPIVGPIVSMLFSIWITIGVAVALLKISRGQEAAIGDIFNGGPYFGRILLASLLLGLIVMAVFGVCFGPLMVIAYLVLQGGPPEPLIMAAVVLALLSLIPVIIVSLMFSQYYYLILDRDAGITESLSMSKDIMVGNKLTLFLINLLLFLIVIVSIIPCGLGLLAAAPFAALIKPIVYLAVTGQATADQMAVGQRTV